MDPHADDTLLDQLRTLATRFDPVPQRVTEGAKVAFTWRTVDHELAALAYDSLEDLAATAGVRGVAGPRLLTFEVPGLTVEVEIAEAGVTRRLLGQLVPGGPARVTIRQPGLERSVEADELGRFHVDDLPAGPTSLRCERDVDGRRIVVDTDWHVI